MHSCVSLLYLNFLICELFISVVLYAGPVEKHVFYCQCNFVLLGTELFVSNAS